MTPSLTFVGGPADGTVLQLDWYPADVSFWFPIMSTVTHPTAPSSRVIVADWYSCQKVADEWLATWHDVDVLDVT